MKTGEIIARVKALPSVEGLNAMQETMASTDAKRLILIAPTGSGKTIAFAIRLLRNIDAEAPGVKAVVLAPSRELALQLSEVIRSLAAPLKTVTLYGGHSFEDERNSLSVNTDIVVATPGRLVDHLTRETLNIVGARSLVIDEYDKMLELGFEQQMRRVVRKMTHRTLTMLTSATRLRELPEWIGNEADFKEFDFSPESERDEVPEAALEVVKVDSPEADKLHTLASLLNDIYAGNDGVNRVIVFVNHRESAERVHKFLKKEGFPVGLYHGALDQQQRRIAVELLHNATTPILVATDLAARGLDIADIKAVVHYHIPVDEQAWTHRNGRSGRQGAVGTVYVVKGPQETLPPYIVPDKDVDVDDSMFGWGLPHLDLNATLYFNAGKKEKISRGDIVGFLIQKGGLDASQIGRITLDDHYALAAIPASRLSAVIAAIADQRIKNKRVRITPLTT